VFHNDAAIVDQESKVQIVGLLGVNGPATPVEMGEDEKGTSQQWIEKC